MYVQPRSKETTSNKKFSEAKPVSIYTVLFSAPFSAILSKFPAIRKIAGAFLIQAFSGTTDVFTNSALSSPQDNGTRL